ncbi:MAG: hypothetical protein H3C35_07155, partial [Bacteroidetes bacterium]|nr:hypothetical protein [Bacteroidota bacterium]
IFLHTNNKENASNYGIYLGGLWNYEKKFCSSWFNSGFVYSKKINKYFIPYISINLTYDGEIKRIDYTASYPALGADIKIPLSERLSILLTPELGYVFKYQKGGYPLNDAVNHRSSMNIGLIFDLY